MSEASQTRAADANALPVRPGDRPRTTPCAPHSQIDQLPPPAEAAALSAALVAEISALPHVYTGGSMRAPPGTVGLYMEGTHACGSDRAFLLNNEFAHVHVEDDGSLHAILPEPLRTAAIEAGWAEPHPLAGRPTVSPDTVMIYAPRNNKEVEVIASLVVSSWHNARQDQGDTAD
ncbi:luciferase domain-containing protein [Kineobactrum salinum]|uniref:Phospholipase n=1 Tax=Kineobactrum salinum TaxID=2708301 RepID=A0A6C0TYD2_9GAMM|nr:luciferase family protein [Kineobactrum salinum]QIB64842.1 phospholipase [Kineobactrum salinum]